MQNTFLQVRGDQIIIDKNELVTYAAAAAVVLVLLVVVTVMLRHRKKSFIKTIPTNLKAQ